MTFNPELRSKATEVIGRYPLKRSALLPLLHLVQHADGHLSDDGIAECAELLDLTKAEVNAVATFYTMYKRDKLGTHLVSVCTNFACAVRGSKDTYARLSSKLGVGHNGTTADGAFTLEHAECLGNCEGAPVVTVDYLNYECVTPDAASELVDRVAAGEPPPPTRGFTPTGIREVSHRLAGLGPVAGGPGVASAQARAADGAIPAVASGPGAAAAAGSAPKIVASPFAPQVTTESRAEAQQEVREVGQNPDEVSEEAGTGSREFPTEDAEEPDGGGPDDPRHTDQAEDVPGDAGGAGDAPDQETP